MIKTYTPNLTDCLAIDLELCCNVEVFYTRNSEIEVEVNDEEIEVSYNSVHNLLSIKQPKTNPSSGTTIHIGDVFQNSNSTTVISGSGIHIGSTSRTIYVNGKQIEIGSVEPAKPNPKVVIRIPTTLEVRLDALLYGGEFSSNVLFAETFLTVKGHSKASLVTECFDGQVSGSGELRIEMRSGEFDVGISGSADVVATGEFKKVKAKISGSGDIYTIGTCLGNYTALVSGSGSISHKGEVKGKVRESVSGTGRIRV